MHVYLDVAQVLKCLGLCAEGAGSEYYFHGRHNTVKLLADRASALCRLTWTWQGLSSSVWGCVLRGLDVGTVFMAATTVQLLTDCASARRSPTWTCQRLSSV